MCPQLFPSFVQPYTYTAREYDQESGLYYYRARYYDAKAGRFISEDPIGLKGGDVNYFSYVDSVGKPYVETNLYQYVGNNPVNFVDPLGLYMFPGGDLYEKCMENAPKDCKQKYDNCMKNCKSKPCSYDRSKDPFNRHCEMVCTDDYIGCTAMRTAVSTYCRFRYTPNLGPRPIK